MDYKLPAQKELSRLNKYPAVEEILVLGAAVTNNIEGFYSHSPFPRQSKVPSKGRGSS